jgi:hypothetical protein
MILIFILFVFSIVTLLYLLKGNSLQNKETLRSSIKPIGDFDDNSSEFENDDCDREVDEMPDDCLIYDHLFDEE